MTVYVDTLFTMTPRTKQGKKYGNQWCHMTVGKNDDLKELHLIAEKIGLNFSFFQDHKTFPHYDLTPSKRSLALKQGAIEITHIERYNLCRRSKKVGTLTT